MEENRQLTPQEAIKEHYKKIGSMGGKTLAKTKGSQYFSAIGKKGLQKRWGKHIALKDKLGAKEYNEVKDLMKKQDDVE